MKKQKMTLCRTVLKSYRKA